MAAAASNAGDLALNIAVTAQDQASGIIAQIAASIAELAGGGAFGALAVAAVAAGAAVAGVGVIGTKMAGDFQSGLERLVTSAGEAQGNLQMVGDGILKISTDTGTTTDQLVAAMYNIESGGQHGADGLHVLQVAAQGAKTENADLTTVAKTLMTTMTDYKMPTDQATAAMNGLIATVKGGRTTLQEMSTAMGNVLPIASSLGISFPQVAAAMDALTNAGQSAQRSSQNLAHFLTALEAPSGVAAKSMVGVGLTANQLRDTLANQGLPAALQLIEDHIGTHLPKNSVEAETAMKDITGGLVGLKEAAAITEAGLKHVAQTAQDIAAAMGHAGDSVDGFTQIQQTLNFQLDRVKTGFEALMIVLGEKLLPIVTPLVEAFANFIGTLTDLVSGMGNTGSAATSFSDILKSLGIDTKALQGVIDSLGTAIGYIKGIFGEVATIVGDVFNIAFQLAAKIIGDLTNSQLPNFQSGLDGVNGVLSTIFTALNQVVTGLESFKNNIDQVWSTIKPIFDDLATAAQQWGANFMNGFGQGVMSALDGIVTVVQQVMGEIEAYMGFASPTKKGPGRNVHKWGLGLAQGMAQGLLQGQGALVDAAGNVMGITVKTIQKKHVAPVQAHAQTTASPIKQAMAPLTQQLTAASSAIAPGVAAIGKQLSTICSTHAAAASSCASHAVTKGLANKIHAGTGHVKAAAHAVGAAHAPAAHGAAQHAAAAGAHMAKVPAAIKKHTPAVKKAATDLGHATGAVTPPLKIASDGFKNLGDAANKVGNILKDTGMKVKGAFTGVGAWIKGEIDKAVAAFGNFKDKVKQAIDYMKPGLQQLGEIFNIRIKPALDSLLVSMGPVWDMAKNIGKAALDGVVQLGKWATSADTLKAAWDGVVAAGKILMDALSPIIAAIGPALLQATQGLVDAWNTQLLPAFKDVGKTIQENKPLFDALGKGLGLIAAVILGVVVGAITGLIGALGQVVAGLAKVLGGIVEFCAGVFKFLTGLVTDIYDLITGNFGKLNKDLTTMEDGLKEMFKGVWDIIVGLWQASFGSIQKLTEGFCKGILKFFQNLSDDLVGHSIIPDMIKAIQRWFQTLVDFIPTMMTNIGKFFTDGWDKIKTIWTTETDNIKKTLDTWWANIKGAVNTGITNVEKLFTDMWTSVKKIWTDATTAVVKTVTDWWTNVKKLFTDAITAIEKFVTDFWTTVKAAWNVAVAALLKIVTDWWAAIQKIFAGAWTNYIQKPMADIVTNFTNWYNTMLTNFTNWGTNLIKMFATSITNAIPSITTAVQGVATAIANVLGIASPAKTGPLSTADKWMPNLMNMLASQIKAGTPGVQSAAQGLAQAIKTQMDAAIASMKTSITDLQNQISSLKGVSNGTSWAVKSDMGQMNSAANQGSANLNATMEKINNDNAIMIANEKGSWSIVKSTADAGAQSVDNSTTTAAASSKGIVNQIKDNSYVTATVSSDATRTIQAAGTIAVKSSNGTTWAVRSNAQDVHASTITINQDKYWANAVSNQVFDWLGIAHKNVDEALILDNTVAKETVTTQRQVASTSHYVTDQTTQQHVSMDDLASWVNNTGNFIQKITTGSINSSQQGAKVASNNAGQSQASSGQSWDFAKMAGTAASTALNWAKQSWFGEVDSTKAATFSNMESTQSLKSALTSTTASTVSRSMASLSGTASLSSTTAANASAQEAAHSSTSAAASTTYQGVSRIASVGSTQSANLSGTSAAASSSYQGVSRAAAAGSTAAASLSGTSAAASTTYQGMSTVAAAGSTASSILSGTSAAASTSYQGMSTVAATSSQAARDLSGTAASASSSYQGMSTAAANASKSAAGASGTSAAASSSYQGMSQSAANKSKESASQSGVSANLAKASAILADAAKQAATATAAATHIIAAQLHAFVDQLAAQISAQIAGLQAMVAGAAAGMIAAANSAAAAAAAVLGHSKPKEGPMKDDDKWTKHFMENMCKPIVDGVPKLHAAATAAAGAIVKGFAPIINSITKPTTSTVSAANSAMMTMKNAGSLPIAIAGGPSTWQSIQAPPKVVGPPVVVASHPTTVVVKLDSKVIAKAVTKVQHKDIHAQGAARNR